MKALFLILPAALLLAACEAPAPMADAPQETPRTDTPRAEAPAPVAKPLIGGPYLATVPDSVLAIVGPNQNLSAVRVMPEDGCYWYLYEGPVETTLLPLRTAQGNPICSSRYSGGMPEPLV